MFNGFPPSDSHREAQALGEWLASDRFNWTVFATLTFGERFGPFGPSPDRCLYHVRRWIRSLAHRPAYFIAVESGGRGGRTHAHALLGPGGAVDRDPQRILPELAEPQRRELWSAWFKRFGRCRFEPIDDKTNASFYCSKYLVKEPLGWDLDVDWDAP